MDNATIFIKPEPLKRIYLELSRACNLSCAMCFRHFYKEDSTSFMDESTLKNVIDQIAHSSVEEVILGGIGEPFLSPYWKDAIKWIKDAGKRIAITTNGTLIDQETAAFLVANDVDRLYISVESSTLGHNNVESTIHVADMMNIMKQSSHTENPVLCAEVVLMKSTLEDSVMLIKELSRHGFKYVLLNNILPMTPKMDNEVLYEKSKDDNLWHELSAQLYKDVAVEYPEFSIKTERLCRFVERNATVIASDGSVSPCYRLLHDGAERVLGRTKMLKRYSFGNVNSQSLEEIWESSSYTIFRFKVHHALYPSCTDCGFHGGCGFLFSTDGDCRSNVPSCGDCLWYRQIILCP